MCDQAGGLTLEFGQSTDNSGLPLSETLSETLSSWVGPASQGMLTHRRFLEIAAASAVRTAAYLDLYQQKALPSCADTAPGRELRCRILAMLDRF